MENKAFIIGEIGQNHNGSIDIAKLLIDIAAQPVESNTFDLKLNPIDAVKFTKRDLSQELSERQMNQTYNSPNSFGKTYGEHRSYLEFDNEQIYELYKYTKSKKLDFVITLCAIGTLNILNLLTPDYIKVASRDLTNHPLLEELAKTKIPIIVSTGMTGKNELNEALNIITKYHSDISILHCVSQYPTLPKNTNLKTITYLKNNYSQFDIGYSDHTIGISASVAAVAMGAKIIEKHITLNRKMKGSDHAASLGIDGINRMVRDIRLMELSLGKEDLFYDEVTNKNKVKLERSIATNRTMKEGEIITSDDIHMLSPGDGFKWSQRSMILGKKLKKNMNKNEIIYYNYIMNI